MVLRSSQGFTFVEAMAVAVIVSILAAVAIPVYSGYVKSQRRTVAKNLAQAAAVTANVYYRRNGSDPTAAQLSLFLPDSARYRVTVSNPNIIVVDSMGSTDTVKATASYR